MTDRAPPPLDLARLLAAPEGQYAERKSLWDRKGATPKPLDRRKIRDLVAEYVAAFANADGGVLVLGAENDGTPTGHGYPDDVVEQMLRTPCDRLRPPLRAGERLLHAGHELLVFDVDAAPSAVMVVGDGFPRRVGDTVVAEAESAIVAIKAHGRVESIETDPAPGASLAQLDLDAVRTAQVAAGYGERPVEDYLVARRLADWRGGALVLRQAALLLFARHAHDIANPNAGVRILVVDGTERLGGTRLNTRELAPPLEGALPAVIQAAHALISRAVSQPRLHDLFFREETLYPQLAWQEALVNAVAHRDYRVQSRGVEIWLYDDHMEVTSPGALLPEIPLASLLRRERRHASRNPVLARVLTELGLMRQQGEGIPRMYEEVERAWQRLPDLRADASSFTVTLFSEPVFDTTDTAWIDAVRRMRLPDRQSRALVAFVGRTFTSGDYQDLNRIDRDQAYRELRELIESGLISPPEGLGRAARYKVLRDGAGEATLPRPSLEALAAAMATTGKIRNEDYRTAFGVSRQTAKRALARLVADGELNPPSGEKRGQGYTCGPRWQAWVTGATTGATTGVATGVATDVATGLATGAQSVP